jgi:hypothetical protein
MPDDGTGEPAGQQIAGDHVFRDDLTMLSVALTVLGVGTPEEAVRLFMVNVPESQVATCMSERGFSYQPDPASAPEAVVARDPFISLSDEEFAERYGLGMASIELGLFPSTPESVDPLAGAEVAERDAYLAAMTECRDLGPARLAYEAAFNTALQQYVPVVEADDRVIAALETWRACIADAGYRYESPQDMRADWQQQVNRARSAEMDAVFVQEVALAQANVPCERAFDAMRREVIADRFAEFQRFFETALAQPADPNQPVG